jgi:hypothetical protein
VIRRRRLDLPLRIVAHQAVLPPLQFMRDLRCQVHDGGRRVDPALRRVAGVTRPLEVIFWRLVAVAADVFWYRLSFGMAVVAGSVKMRAG